MRLKPQKTVAVTCENAVTTKLSTKRLFDLFVSCYFVLNCVLLIQSTTLPGTNSSHLPGIHPKGKRSLPTIHFQVLLLLV